jgi:hypothetical protein
LKRFLLNLSTVILIVLGFGIIANILKNTKPTTEEKPEIIELNVIDDQLLTHDEYRIKISGVFSVKPDYRELAQLDPEISNDRVTEIGRMLALHAVKYCAGQLNLKISRIPADALYRAYEGYLSRCILPPLPPDNIDFEIEDYFNIMSIDLKITWSDLENQEKSQAIEIEEIKQ